MKVSQSLAGDLAVGIRRHLLLCLHAWTELLACVDTVSLLSTKLLLHVTTKHLMRSGSFWILFSSCCV